MVDDRADSHAERVGEFTWYIAEDRWIWDDAMYRMHGYVPGEVAPTTDLVRHHKHPDHSQDRSDVAWARRDGRAFSDRHRIVGADGIEREVVVTGRASLRDGEATDIRGYMIDVSDPDGDDELLRAARERVGQLEEALVSRATIDQAKGALMFVYSLSADGAFDLLRWLSQRMNVKLRDVAARVVSAVADTGASTETQEHVTEVLLNIQRP